VCVAVAPVRTGARRACGWIEEQAMKRRQLILIVAAGTVRPRSGGEIICSSAWRKR
jgi:hypothetical protein